MKPEPIQSLSCLIIDPDIPSLRNLQRYANANERLDVKLIAKSGRAASGFLRAESVDLVIMNPALPDSNGFELIAALDEVPETIIVSDRPEFAYFAFQIGSVDYLLKPFNAAAFEASLEKLFHKLEERRELEYLRKMLSERS